MKCPIDVEKKVAEMRQELHPDALVEDAYRAILGAMNGAYCDGLQGKGYRHLVHDYQDCKYLWDLGAVRRWGQGPATQKQLEIIHRRCKGFDATGLTKGAASQILNRLFSEPTKGKGRRRA